MFIILALTAIAFCASVFYLCIDLKREVGYRGSGKINADKLPEKIESSLFDQYKNKLK